MAETYLHRIYGIYENATEASMNVDRLMAAGFRRDQVKIVDKPESRPETQPDSEEVRNDMLVDGAIGTAIGAGIGFIGEAALAAANISLFIASPIIGTLTMMGWGAALGGIVGAAAGAGDETKKDFAELVKDAVKSGHVVLVAYSESEAQTAAARKIIGDSMQATSASNPT